tara:strand:+ start:287 stop:451 length:165 start_codon:yes stop_codon:yes gene_type:complete
MYERIEDKIRSVENYNTTIPFLKHLTKTIVEEYILEINEWRKHNNEHRFPNEIH